MMEISFGLLFVLSTEKEPLFLFIDDLKGISLLVKQTFQCFNLFSFMPYPLCMTWFLQGHVPTCLLYDKPPVLVQADNQPTDLRSNFI